VLSTAVFASFVTMSACCFKFGPCRMFCGATDKIGCVKSKDARACIMGVDVCLTVTALIMIIVALCGAGSDDDMVKRFAWAQRSSDKTSAYSNLWGVTVKFDEKYDQFNDDDWGGYYQGCDLIYWSSWYDEWYSVDFCVSKSWDDIVDDVNGKKANKGTDPVKTTIKGTNITISTDGSLAEFLQAEQYAEDCRDAGNSGLTTCIVLLIITLLGGWRRCTKSRFIEEEDVGRKCLYLISSLVPVIVNIGTVADYQSSCMNALNDAEFTYNETKLQASAEAAGVPEAVVMKLSNAFKEFKDGQGDWKAGPGFGCICAALACFLTCFVLHLIVPAQPIPDPKDPPKDNEDGISVGVGKV